MLSEVGAIHCTISYSVCTSHQVRPGHHGLPKNLTSAVVIHYEEALYQVYAHLPLPLQKTFGDSWCKTFTGQLPFLSHNQQCKSMKETEVTCANFLNNW